MLMGVLPALTRPRPLNFGDHQRAIGSRMARALEAGVVGGCRLGGSTAFFNGFISKMG